MAESTPQAAWVFAVGGSAPVFVCDQRLMPKFQSESVRTKCNAWVRFNLRGEVFPCMTVRCAGSRNMMASFE